MNQPQSHIEFRDPLQITVHPSAKSMPQWDEEDEHFLALVADIRERGIDQPLAVDHQDRLLDGRHRWRAAKRLRLPSVPVVVRSDAEVATVIIQSLVQRRHYNKSALAYLAYPLLEHAHHEAIERQARALKRGAVPPTQQVKVSTNVVSLSEQIGISRKLFDLAAKVHTLFARDPGYRLQMEPRILDVDDPVGLGAAVAGYGGLRTTKGIPRPDSGQLMLFDTAVKTLQHRFEYWTEMQDDERDALRPRIREAVEAMPEDLRREFSRAIKAVEKSTEGVKA